MTYLEEVEGGRGRDRGHHLWLELLDGLAWWP